MGIVEELRSHATVVTTMGPAVKRNVWKEVCTFRYLAMDHRFGKHSADFWCLIRETDRSSLVCTVARSTRRLKRIA